MPTLLVLAVLVTACVFALRSENDGTLPASAARTAAPPAGPATLDGRGPSAAASSAAPDTEEALTPARLRAALEGSDDTKRSEVLVRLSAMKSLAFDADLARLAAGWLAGDDVRMTGPARMLLARMGPQTKAWVLPLLGEAHADVRWRALLVVHGWRRFEFQDLTLPPMLPLLEDENGRVRDLALSLLARGAPYDEQVAAWLLDHVEPADLLYYPFETALAGLGEQGREQVVAMLDDPHLVYNALGALGQAPKAALRAALPRIADFIADDRDENLQVAAIHTLILLQGDCEAALPGLRAALRGESFPVRREALMVLEQMGERAAPAVPELIDVLASGDERLATRAAGVLGDVHLEPARVLPALRRSLEDDGGDAAARAMAAYGEAALAPLRDALDQGDDDVRYFALAGVAELGRKAAPLARRVIALIDDTDEDLAVRAAMTCARLGEAGDGGIPGILRRLQDDTLLPGRAASVLMALGPPAERALLSSLQRGSRSQRRHVLEVLANARGHSAFALEALTPYLRSDDVDLRLEATRAVVVSLWSDPYTVGISQRSAPRLRRRVRKMLAALPRDDDREIRQIVEGALEELNRPTLNR